MNHSIRLIKSFLSAAVLIPLVAAAQTLTITNGIQTYSALTNTTVTMTGRCELRVTGTNNPISGSIINLNSSDAWFFLSNIRPSTVSASCLSQVLVNGSAAVAGSNCRLDEYAMGTVIIPHSPSITPLQIFSGPNFVGPSAQFGLYTYHTNTALGALNKNIGSFKLKRGYSATFAQNVDGAGASKVFVAQDDDLEAGLMSASLSRPLSYVRVFPWRWTGKKGWAGGVQTLVDPLWSYDWDNITTSTLDAEYVPMRWGQYWNAYANINGKQKSTHVLGFNEPDKSDQANMSVATAIASWPGLMQSGLRAGAPAVSDSATTGMGLEWLYSFMSQADALGYRVDFVPIHFYKCDWTATQFYNYLAGIYLQTGRPIWVTEFNNGANWCGSTPTLAENATKISQFIDMLESAPFVERYAIYNWVGTNRAMVADDNTLTPAGIVYRDKQSSLAYTQTLPSGGSRSIAQFLFETNTLDSSGYGNNGLAVGIPAYTPGHSPDSIGIVLDGTNNYIQLPPTVANSTNFSFAAWVYWNGGDNWQRIFDFGDDSTHYLFLTPGSSSGTLRFAIRNGGSEQIVETTGLTGGQWQHVAITLSGSNASLYTNGVLAASSSVMTNAPSNFNPNRNYLGRSQFAADPLFQGCLDEVQIADYALTDSQIAALQTNQPPQFTTNFLDRGTATPFQVFSTNITGTATDPDCGDTLTYSKASGLTWLTVNADGTLTGTPGANDGGTNYFTVRVTDLAGASALAVMTLYVPITYGNGTWTNNASGSWDAATNWSGGSVANGAGYTADFSALNITADRTVTLEVSRSIGALKFGDTSGAQNWTLTSSGDVLTLDTGSSTSPSIVVTNTATIAAPLDSANGFTKSGPGTLVLSGANSLSGTVYIDTSSTTTSEGIVRAANPGALLSVTNIQIRNNNAGSSTLQLDGSLGNVTTPAATALNGRTVNVVAIQNLSGSNTLAGGTTLNVGGGYYVLQSDAGTLNLGGTITSVATGVRTLSFQGAGNFLVSGSIQNGSSTNNLTKTGAGTLTLAGANTFSGTNRITAGKLMLANSAALQNSILDMYSSDAGTLSFGALTSATLGGLTGSRTLALTNSSNEAVTLTVGGNSQSLAYSGVLTGSGGVVKTGSAALTLSGASTFTGATRISGGTLVLANSAALQNSTLYMDAPDTVTLSFGTLTSATVGGLGGSRNIALTNNSNAAVTLTVGGNGLNTAYAGILSGSGSLVKNGAGSLVLSRSNSYTGNTTVNGGTLKLSREPIVKLTFDSVSGTAAGSVVTNDGTGGSALNGAVVNGTTGVSFVSGKVGNALSLAGDGSYVSIADRVTSLDGNTAGADWTLAMWIKTTQPGAGYAYQGNGGWTWNNTAFYLNQGSTSAGTRVGAVRYSGGWLTGTASVNNGAWRFIAVTAASGAKSIYIDGNLDSTTTSWTNVSAGNLFWIGGTADSGDGVARMNGQLDEVSIYSRALTLAEVRSLTNATVTLTGTYGGQLPSSTALAVSSGATFDLGGNSQTVASLADNSGSGTVTNSGVAAVTLTLGATSGTKTFSGVIADGASSGAISLIKNGAATAVLSGANSYRGATTVNAGALLVNGSLGAGAVTVTGGMLGGTGTLGGPVTVQAAGTLSPGSNVIAWLTINNALTNSGVLVMELSKTGSALTNDTINGLSVLALGGTLSVTNIGSGILTVGDSFKLFSATNYTGVLAGIVPATPGAGLAWDAGSLTVNGTLAVALGAVNPQIAQVFLDGTNLVLSGAGGAAGYGCSVLTATNVAEPMDNWQVAGSGVCDVNGNFAFTNAMGLDDPQRFYRVRVP